MGIRTPLGVNKWRPRPQKPACAGTCAGQSKLCMHQYAPHVSLGLSAVHGAGAMKPKSKRTISFPEDRQTPPAWLTLTVTLMICYATIVAFGLLRAVHL
jgi:hypothetical protein